MRFVMNFLWIAGWMTWAGTAFATEASLPQLEARVEEWTRLRAALASEERDWKSEQQWLEAEISLMEREKERLKAEIERFQSWQTAQASSRQKLEARIRDLRGVQEALIPLLDRLESALRAEVDALPPFFQERFRGKLPAAGAGESVTPARGVDRLQRVVSTLTELESLHVQVHRGRELLETGEGRRQVEVLYFGVTRAFALQSAGDWAAVGEYGQDGWRWTPRPELAADIRRSLRIADGEAPAAFIRLPLRRGGSDVE